EDVIKAGVVIVGSPNTVREKLAEYQDLAGFNTSLTKTQFGTLPDDMARANMTGIAEEILPPFRDRHPQGARREGAEKTRRSRRRRSCLAPAGCARRSARGQRGARAPLAVQSSLTPDTLTTSPQRPRSAAI